MPEKHETGFWRSVGDSLRLVVRAVLISLLLALLSFIPVVGTVLAAVLGFLFTARILALELTTRPLEARGLTRVERRAALRTRSPRVLGFGVGGAAVLPRAGRRGHRRCRPRWPGRRTSRGT